ncbi:MAG: bifunctional anthranilate synthase component II/anthranilate phosphoribosyltransferase [Chloroflexota bacterium]|nr:MAG: bifunctional anthranilate synthase component II/anthranilate phosphoribosyltransferase [Chloroflexota bacterium]
MILVIDNYDSFTYNLVQYLGELGTELRVFRNDQITLDEIRALNPSHIVISPGPGEPTEAGISNAVIRELHQTIPILGVCLGHQCMGYVFGGTVTRAPRLMHGKTSRVFHRGRGLFEGMPNPFEAGRYHSLIVQEPLPEPLVVTAFTDQGEVMGLQHKTAPMFGVQFHPESILTPHGKQLLKNFLEVISIKLNVPSSRAASIPTTQTFNLQPSTGEKLMIREAIAKLMEGKNLSQLEAESVMQEIMDGAATPAQMSAFLVALRLKGETMEEIAGCARVMRDKAVRVSPQRTDLVDTAGTGGDKSGTFNISTTAAFVIAGAGLGVAKHGNRAISGQSGSADVLEALGVNFDLTPEQSARCIDEVGIGFLFAPKLHPAMKNVAPVRKELGVRTVFNILGPLTNPAYAPAQIIGVFDGAYAGTMAHVLKSLGSRAAFVFHSADGLDELTTTSENHITFFTNGIVHTETLDARELGLERAAREELRGGNPQENANIARQILRGEERGAKRDVVILNAAAALVAGGKANDLREGLELANDALDSGRAYAAMENLVALSNSYRQT